jgi:hypothetical protein
MNEKNCFVVMGFGTKTDLATGRKLNLDKSYQALIKPVIQSKGMTCVRADEIKHTGAIDVPMYQQLLTADVVVADLSTANVNAFYELGIRHALRPRTTIIISEDQLCYPFDVNHIQISKYTHLGDSIDYFEVLRFQKLLGDTLDAVLNEDQPDSPVYTFLDNLVPPSLKEKAQQVALQVGEALSNNQPASTNPDDNGDDETLALIIKKAEDALKNKQYDLAKGFFNSAFMLASCNNDQKITSNNSYLIQRLALATYKAKQPDEVTALKEAIALLNKIGLTYTNDPETVSIAGAIEKKLYENGQGDEHLDNAQRGFYLLDSRYYGINLAYLLNCRANSSLDPTQEDKIADTVWANRIRRDVLEMCEADLKKLNIREQQAADNTSIVPTTISDTQTQLETEQKFWILVNKAEAYFGLGEQDKYEEARHQAESIPYQNWMMESFTHQLEMLRKILEDYHLKVSAEGVLQKV